MAVSHRTTTQATTIDLARFSSPLGQIIVAVHAGRICAMGFKQCWGREVHRLEKRFGPIEFRRAADPASVVSRLKRYFSGELEILNSLELDPGGTPFQRQIWNRLRKIHPGQTRSYAALARALGRPAAFRAVGAAVGANPIAIVIPCHRAIGSDRSLTGYLGGLERKRWLLRHEGALSDDAS